MYRSTLPSVCKQPRPGGMDRRFLVSIALSVLLHLLFVLALIERQDKYRAVTAEKIEKGMEVMLTSAPKANVAAKASKPAPPRPKSVNTTKPLVKPEPVPKPLTMNHPQPIPKPPKPKPQKLAIQPKPIVRPKRSEAEQPESIPEFKDEFAELSTDYAKEAGGVKPSGNVSKTPDTGIHPGAILNINPRIYYPRQAMQRGLQGVVVVLIHIGIDGHADDVDLLHSSGYEELDNQVLGAVQHWRFRPPMRGNTPVEGTYKHTVIFGADEEVIDDFQTHWQEIKLLPAGG